MSIPRIARIEPRIHNAEHRLIVTDTDGAEHTFASDSGMDLIRSLQHAAYAVRLSESERAALAAEVFARIMADLEKSLIVDDDGHPVDHDRVHRITIVTSQYDNGHFPSGDIDLEDANGNPIHIVATPENNYGVAAIIDDGDLADELAELGGAYRHDPSWKLVLVRGGAATGDDAERSNRK